MQQNLQEQANYINENFTKSTLNFSVQNDNLIFYVEKLFITDFLTFLRDDQNLSFKTLLDVFGADMLGLREPRFEVIYNLLSYKLNNRITVKVALNDGEEVDSVSSVFSSAGWFEREVFDMYGIKFSNHP
ncbi:MAG: NADH-quinone oxidoreductase subunit C, partial [Alphaproteobacteria bacterium]